MDEKCGIDPACLIGMDAEQLEAALREYSLRENAYAFNFSDRVYVSGADEILVHMDCGVVASASRRQDR